MCRTNNKVLIVEDSLSILSSIKNVVETKTEFKVLTARTLAEAKEAVSREKQNILTAILDLHLPDSMGGEIVDFFISEGIAPIILTSSDSELMHDIILKKKVIDYVIKRNMNELQYLAETLSRLKNNQSRSILVVDDSPSTRSYIRSLLERQFINVIEASNGNEALRLLSLHKDIQLIITDYNMPDMKGDELIVNVREKYSRNELAILSVSASSEDGVSVKLLKSGANDFIKKPFAYEEFYCRVIQNIDAIERYRQLEEAAITDYLTGLYNRKYLFDMSEKIFENARRGKISLTVAILDIDHFKKINDAYGHDAGDLVLKQVSKILQEEIRSSDILARIGGEEFCIVSMNLNDADAFTFMDRIRKRIEGSVVQAGENSIQVSMSIGFSGKLADSFEAMMKDADQALYDAKNSGRNQVVQKQSAEAV
ncbi:MAG: diguanylate cyclase [Spirochaetia bacterium]|nr:diguanylate cyclase [Spirochaetia bacterium]